MTRSWEKNMNKQGTDIWCEICDSIVEDTDDAIVNKKKSVKVEHEDGSWGWKLDMLKPYKKIDRNGLHHFAGEVVSLAAKADRNENTEDGITVTCGPVYHFFKEETVKRFMDRVHDIIEAAQI